MQDKSISPEAACKAVVGTKEYRALEEYYHACTVFDALEVSRQENPNSSLKRNPASEPYR